MIYVLIKQVQTYKILPLIKKLHFIENHDAYDNIIIIAKYVNFKGDIFFTFR